MAPLAMASSVYLTRTSLYASGEYAADSLAKRTTEIKMQRWFRLRLDRGHLAWAPEDYVVRREDLVKRCFIKRVTDLHVGPHLKTLAIGTLGPGARLDVTGAVITGPSHDGWVPVTMGDASGFVARRDVVMAEDIQGGHALIIDDGATLRSAPQADADITAHARALQNAVVVETASLRWGRVAIKDRGELWWPVDEGASGSAGSHAAPELPKFKTADLFLHHKIHDIASSPLIPNLKILSAQGVYRSLDGEEWEKLPQFADANYPIAISESGRIFVGTLVSDDQGETFHSFLRLENIVSPLHRRWKTNPKRMRILEIAPQSADGRKLSLKVDIGLQFPVSVATTDQGQTWAAQ